METKTKPEIFDDKYVQKLIQSDELSVARKHFFIPEAAAYFGHNSLGGPSVNAFPYIQKAYIHWETQQVEGYFNPMKDIGDKPTGFVESREKFREYVRMLLGANTTNEIAILNDQSIVYGELFRWLAEKMYRQGRRVILYQGNAAFPSDKLIVEHVVKVINLNIGSDKDKLILADIPDKENGLIDYDALRLRIQGYDSNLGVVAFGDGGVSWKTSEVVDFEWIGKEVKKAGGKFLTNLAHALFITDLKLHQWHVSAAVGCSYKFGSGGPGGPSYAFIHEDEDTSDLARVGWFSCENTIDMLQGAKPIVKKGAQQLEASNPPVIGWMPAYAALEEYFSWPAVAISKKREGLLNYFDELFLAVQENFGSPLKMITPIDCRATEIAFSTTDSSLVEKLYEHLSEHCVVCDLREKKNIRIGMTPLITSFEEVRILFIEIWNFFERQ